MASNFIRRFEMGSSRSVLLKVSVARDSLRKSVPLCFASTIPKIDRDTAYHPRFSEKAKTIQHVHLSCVELFKSCSRLRCFCLPRRHMYV